MQQFLLGNDHAYGEWRERKLHTYPDNINQLIVTIQNPYKLTIAERNKLLGICQKTNLVIYRIVNKTSGNNKDSVLALAMQLELRHMDDNLCADQNRISSIQVTDEELKGAYIPYTSKSLNWHTDGYYNQDAQRIRAFIMHCVRPANSGGENAYLDPEIIYILLRDHDPKDIQALMDKNAMTIPPNRENNEEIRSAKTGPVFSLDESTQSLHMRYTARSHNIFWQDNAATKRARANLLHVLNNNCFQFCYRLARGEGVICNNVLHNRAKFTDHPKSKRLLYRARFYERVADAGRNHDLQKNGNQCCG